MSTCFESSIVISRKPHQCRVCGERTIKGERLISRSGTDCDGVWRIHMHPECEQLTKGWDSADWECISPGEVKRPSTL